MAKDNLNGLGSKVNEQLDKSEFEIDKSGQKQMAVHIGYYKLAKLYTAIHGGNLIDITDKAMQTLVDNGFFDDIKDIQ